MKRSLRVTAVCGLLAIAAGCGLENYEDRMLAAQARAQSFEEGMLLLGEPIEPPKTLENIHGNMVPVEVPVFFRPPRGFATKPDESLDGKLVFRHRNLGRDARKGLSQEQEAALEVLRDMYVAGAADRATLRAFAVDVVQAFRGIAGTPRRPVTKPPSPGGGVTEVESYDFDDSKSSYCSYFVKGAGKTMFAVVFECEKDKRDRVRKVLDLAVEWVALDSATGGTQGRYERLKKSRNSRASRAFAPSATAGRSFPREQLHGGT